MVLKRFLLQHETLFGKNWDDPEGESSSGFAVPCVSTVV